MAPHDAGPPQPADPISTLTTKPSLRGRLGRLLPPVASIPLRSHFGPASEPELAALDRFVRRGDTVVDIGAARGVYTYRLRRAVGRSGTVLAYEPQPAMLEYLRAGLSARSYDNIIIRDIALSDSARTDRLTVPIVDGEAKHGFASLERQAGAGVTVQTARLDDEVDGYRVSFIKCDVEGHENMVLAGATRLLAERQATWLVEIESRHAAESVERTLSTFAQAGYEPYYLSGRKDITRVPPAHRTPAELNTFHRGRYVNNFFFLPGR